MPTDEKPSRNEDEYFAKREAELLKAQREQATIEAEKLQRRAHYMKCPKCGADLVEQDLHGVKVDVCKECKGIWFDAGELEMVKPEDRNPFRQIIGDFFVGMKK